MSLPEFNTPFLNTYMKMVEDTESPRLFHIWSAVAALAATLGRRCYLPFGPMVIFPNQYVLLVGTPGTRKSTAASMMKRQLKSSTGVRFAPADTAGQRQGLVLAMQGSDAPKEFFESQQLAVSDTSLGGLTLSDYAQVTNEPEDESAAFISQADKHHIMVVASEFSRFIGQNNLQMLDFLTTMWDGDDYEYKTKTGETVLKNPLINLIGCTTPTSIATAMPPAAGGQGFLSRMILVYGSRKYRSVARPSTPDVNLVDDVKKFLADAYYELAGAFDETPDAKAHSESLYHYVLEITDPRFGYYNERRYTHLIKLAMCLAAGRGAHIIVKDDYIEAHRILRATERGMPDALGEFGMNPLAQLKQSVLEFVRTRGALLMEDLRAVFHRDARSTEFMEVLNDLFKSRQLVLTQTATRQNIVSATLTNLKATEDSMIELLTE